ncbi:MAG: DUF389 domain-containing protein [Bacteroidales bacterium]|nr:DUF389 domain-containing protein [Bacteroidales bacterium]
MFKTFIDYLKILFRRYINIGVHVDTKDAAERIKNAIWFRGPNVWILAFAIVLASVGLNVNSTAVIIGAMLVSPLMGPIIGVGLSLGTNDTDLLRLSAKNLLVMVVISLIASTLFFMLSPLALVNPTELEARTSPTIYDVLIAFFGGLAGILENSRKERGTVLSGVAIATALMPPLCTAGYGLAHADMHFFFGALYLFVINSVFIALATYLMVLYLKFQKASGISHSVAKKRRIIIAIILAVVLIPSIWSAFNMVRENNFERNARDFVENNRMVGPRTYIYDFTVKGRHMDVSVSGEPLTDSMRIVFLEKAAKAHIKEKQISITEHAFGMSQTQMNSIINDIYDRTDKELADNAKVIDLLMDRLDAMSAEVETLKKQVDEQAQELSKLQEKNEHRSIFHIPGFFN